MSMHREPQFHAATASTGHGIHAGQRPQAARIRPDFAGDERQLAWDERRATVSDASADNAEDAPGGDGSDAGLEDAARNEHEYLRRRLREELKREPTEEELNEWLRQHTEGH